MDYLILCIGNRDGGDDAVGPFIADNLKDDFTVIDAGVVPENYTSVVKKHSPKNLIIIDAVDMNLNPGDIRVVPKDKIGKMHISTHGIPISVFVGYLEQYIKKVTIIGIQPKNMSGKLTDVVKKSAENLIDLIKQRQFDKIKLFY